jgi:hypothetical protein
MAAIASTDVTNVFSWRDKPYGGKTLYHRILDIALSGNGGTADDIPATTLGFKEIWGAVSVGYLVTSGSALHCVPVVVENDKAGILTINLADSTDATRSAPANVVAAGTLRVHVYGIENN